jgi:trehalose 6-phosphate synthase
MHFFRMRLILALIAGVTLVSVASTYFEVLAHKHMLRQDLERRTAQKATSLLPEIEQALASGQAARLATETARLRTREAALGLGVYDLQGRLLASAGPAGVFNALPHALVDKAAQRGIGSSAFGHDEDDQWLEQAMPLNTGGRVTGALVLVEDAEYIRTESVEVWWRSFLRIAAFVVLIVGVTMLMIRYFLLKPMTRVAERMRRLRMGHIDDVGKVSPGELSLFSPLAREVETMAESLIEARAAAASEARLRDEGAHDWTAERLAVNMRERSGSSRIFVVSNREPYIHVRKGRETVCMVPPSGLVTAVEPVLRACDGVWVAHGSGSEDAANVDAFDRLRVPPDDPQYSLRRVWLSAEEEAGYYDGFANEGLWPLCHIAHTRPIFRASDWECYQEVNEKFAAAVLEEMESSPNPTVFVQDYHLALLPRLIKTARPEARVAIFWHIPWPNPEAFGICPWQSELLDGLLGADLIGFHIPLHCNNFLSTVDRVLESRTDREHMTASRNGHVSTVRPYPVSVALDAAAFDRTAKRPSRETLLSEFGLKAETMVIGVDRLDYTKGIVERLVAIEHLLEEHPWYLERLTMVQIAAPSRTRIASYLELEKRVAETVERINERFQTPQWKPVVLIERQCSHEEVERWYRAADLCLVTSLHDGMNLVAKEFVAARDDEDGVLVLSKFTGAAIELGDALLVNPYDIEGVAEAVHQGLEMPPAERRARMQRMRRQVMEHNVYRWAATLLGDLRELRLENSGVADLGHAGPVAVPAKADTERRSA